MVVGEDPSADRRRDQGRLAGGDRAAGAAARAADRTRQDAQQTSKTLAANIQILLPGEKARPHRHTMNALRFVLEGSGAATIVDGKPVRWRKAT